MEVTAEDIAVGENLDTGLYITQCCGSQASGAKIILDLEPKLELYFY